MPNTFSPERYLTAANGIINDLQWLRSEYNEYWDISDDRQLAAYRYLVAYRTKHRWGDNVVGGIPELIPVSELTLMLATAGARMLNIDKQYRSVIKVSYERHSNISATVTNMRKGFKALHAELRNLDF